MGRTLHAGGVVRAARFACLASVFALLAGAWPAAVHAFPTTGVQKLLVVPVEYAHGGCPSAENPTCPRNTAAQLQTLLQNGLAAYYGNPATGSQTSWQVKVLVNPQTSNGWWPAPSTVAQLEARSKANKNWNAFTPQGSPVRDAAEVVVSQALQRGVISTFELGGYTRFATIHNWHVFGGQSSGSGPLQYTAVYTTGQSVLFKTYAVTAAWVNEGTSDGEMVRVLQHELGHELGPRDLYGQPCPLWPPGEPAPLPWTTDGEREARTECMSTWDLMGLTGSRNPSLMYYTRTLLGWAPSYPPKIRYEPAEFSGQFELSSIEYPNGQPLALHIPDDPQRLILARAFGNLGYFQGFFAECRRTAWNDPIAPPAQGLLISYVDSTRDPQDRQIVIARRFDDPNARQNTLSAVLTPGNSFTSLGRNFNIVFNGFTSNGGCSVYLNRPSLVVETTSFVPAVNPFEGTSAPDLGLNVPKAVYANPGVILNGPRPPIPKPRAVSARGAAESRRLAALSLARSIRVRPPARGKPSTISFVYGNAGAKAGKGLAVVRVQQPWTAQARCGAPSTPRGRVIARVTLPRLAAGAAGVASVRWLPRSSAPAAITVSLRGKAGGSPAAESATTVVGFASGRRRTLRIPLGLTAGPRCTGRIPYAVTPAIVPAGWKATVQGTTKALKRGRPVRVTVVLRPPVGRRAAAGAVPVTVTFGALGVESPRPAEQDGALAPILTPDLEQTVGIDLLGRFALPGVALPPFVLPRSALVKSDRAYPPHGVPPAAPYEQTVTIADCAAATGESVTVSGSIGPPRPGITVHLHYVATGGVLPAGTVADHDVSTSAAGTFEHLFDRQGSAWTVVASVDDDGTYSAAVSAPPCPIPIP